MHRTPQEQLTHFLSDMYSVEQQALAQLVSAPDMAGDPGLAGHFRQHHAETEQQAGLVRERLEARGGSPSAVKDAIMKLGGKGFLLFAKAMPETPGHLTAHAYAYEAMEWAGYAVLVRFAEKAGDSRTAEVARQIQAQERTMMERLEASFDAAEAVSHADTPADDLADHVRTHLAEAHALESQSIQLLKKAPDIAGDPALAAACEQHLETTREQSRLVEERLEALGSSRSLIEDAALAFGAMNWSLFFQAQSDTPAKLAAFAYAFEHLEIAGYELLLRTARRAGDTATEALCERILAEERGMTARLAGLLDSAVDATLADLA